MYYTERAQELLIIDQFYLQRPSNYAEFFAISNSAETTLSPSQQLRYQQLKQAYMDTRQQFRGKQNDDIAIKFLKAHEDLSAFKKAAGFPFESLQAFHALQIFQYAEFLLEIEEFFKKEPGKYRAFFQLMLENEAELTPAQQLTYVQLKVTYTDACQRFSVEKNATYAVSLFDAHTNYSNFKAKAGFDYKSLKAYYETMLATGWRQKIRFSENAGPAAKKMRMIN